MGISFQIERYPELLKVRLITLEIRSESWSDDGLQEIRYHQSRARSASYVL